MDQSLIFASEWGRGEGRGGSEDFGGITFIFKGKELGSVVSNIANSV